MCKQLGSCECLPGHLPQDHAHERCRSLRERELFDRLVSRLTRVMCLLLGACSLRQRPTDTQEYYEHKDRCDRKRRAVSDDVLHEAVAQTVGSSQDRLTGQITSQILCKCIRAGVALARVFLDR